MPTEAEWEYAARAGNLNSETLYSGGDSIETVGWFTGNSNDSTHVSGRKQPNGLKLFDMSGNVSEWCWDWWSSYDTTSQSNPTGPASGNLRIIRGGSFSTSEMVCSVFWREWYGPLTKNSNIGFRIAESL